MYSINYGVIYKLDIRLTIRIHYRDIHIIDMFLKTVEFSINFKKINAGDKILTRFSW